MSNRERIRTIARLSGLPGPASRWSPDAVHPAGFLAGLWHGFAVPLSALVHYFAHDAVSVYENGNGGDVYRLGFVLGVVVVTMLAAVLGGR